MSKNIKALIAVRSGSVRVKNKNLKKFAGSNLLELKIRQLLCVKEIDEVIVNSNSDEMLSIAEKLGAKVIERDEYYATSSTPMREAFVNMAQNFDSDYVLYANCTNPLVKKETYSNAINLFFSNIEKYDSLVSCHKVQEFLYRDGRPMNYNPYYQPRSQDLPSILALNFAISIISRKNMIKHKNVLGSNPYFLELDEVESVDIDTPLDFFVAEQLYNHIRIKKKNLND